MKINEYDKVSLKTGESAYIVEILKEGEAYIADVDKADGSIETEFINHLDIVKILSN